MICKDVTQPQNEMRDKRLTEMEDRYEGLREDEIDTESKLRGTREKENREKEGLKEDVRHSDRTRGGIGNRRVRDQGQKRNSNITRG